MKLIQLTKGFQTMVDDEDYEYLIQWKWHANISNGCIRASKRAVREDGKVITLFMHRLIMNATSDQEVDHKDRNTLNNQKENLRHCTHSQNQANRVAIIGKSGFKGVYWHNLVPMWASRIKVRGKWKSLGMHHNVKNAAKAYDYAAIEAFGEFAVTNKTLGLL